MCTAGGGSSRDLFRTVETSPARDGVEEREEPVKTSIFLDIRNSALIGCHLVKKCFV